jgi:hypothetical protein
LLYLYAENFKKYIKIATKISVEPDKIISYTNADTIDVYDLEPYVQMEVIYVDSSDIGNVFLKMK